MNRNIIRLAGLIGLLAWMLILPASVNAADYKGQFEGKPDDKGNVIFTAIVENIPFSQRGIVDLAKSYLNEEYRTARYSDIKAVDDKGIVYGKSDLNAFYTNNGAIKSDVFSADFFLRFDCKDGRARIQAIFKDYGIQSHSELESKPKENVAIVTVAPFVQDCKNKKTYQKAYAQLQELVDKILLSATNHMQSATPEPEVEEW